MPLNNTVTVPTRNLSASRITDSKSSTRAYKTAIKQSKFLHNSLQMHVLKQHNTNYRYFYIYQLGFKLLAYCILRQLRLQQCSQAQTS